MFHLAPDAVGLATRVSTRDEPAPPAVPEDESELAVEGIFLVKVD